MIMKQIKLLIITASYFFSCVISAQEIPITTTKQKAAEKNMIMLNDNYSSSVVVITPGANQILPVSQHHLNRLITPFSNPEILTSSNITSEVKDNVIYLNLNEEAPATLFVKEKGEEGVALNLTLLPQKIPPREIQLKLTDIDNNAVSMTRKKALSWESSQPYVDTMRELLRSMALGVIPDGYVHDNSYPVLVTCRQSGLVFDFQKRQQFFGHNLMVIVGVAKNISKKSIEFQEMSCGNRHVAAVGAWPIRLLRPGDATEIFIVQKITQEKNYTQKRQQLIGSRP